MTSTKKIVLNVLYGVLAALALHVSLAFAIAGQPGTLDTTWGANSPYGAGRVVQSIGSGNDVPRAVIVQPDGKILVGGGCNVDGALGAYCVARFNPDGSLDTGFGSGGKVSNLLGTWLNYIALMTLEPDAKITLYGHCVGTDFCAIRYKGDGAIDTSFGTDGKIVFAYPVSFQSAPQIARQGDKKLLLAGTCPNAGKSDFCVLRQQADSTLDPTFGSAGRVVVAGGEAISLLMQQLDGKIFLTGRCWDLGPCAVRLMPDGHLDASFGTGGIAPADAFGTANALQPDGKIVIASSCRPSTEEKICVNRANHDGQTDLAFGTAGSVTLPGAGLWARYPVVAVQLDGKIVVGGYCYGATYGNQDMCAFRLTAMECLTSRSALEVSLSHYLDKTQRQTYSQFNLMARLFLSERVEHHQ